MTELLCAMIIPTLNEADTIGELVDTLEDDRYRNLRIVVVDGGSTDGTAATAEKHGATVIQETGPQKSSAGARNQGANYAIGEFYPDVLCFIDGDLELSQDFVYDAMQHFNESEEVAAVRTVADSVRDSLLMKIYSPVADMTRLADETTDELPPPAHFYRRDAFEATGGFEILGFREDWVFYNKVRNYTEHHDYNIVFETDCIRYGRLDSFDEFLTQQAWYGRTFIPYVETAGLWKGIRDLFLLKPLGFLISLIALLAYGPVGHPVLLLAGIPFVVKFAQLVHASLKYSTPYMFPHFLLTVVGNLAFLVGIGRYLLGDSRLSRG